MGYTPNFDDKNSPYYYGIDSTYKPTSSRKKRQQPSRRTAVPSPLLADDPELEGYGKPSFVNRDTNTNKPTPNPNTSSSVTRFGGKEYKMDDPAQTKALNAAITTERKSRPNQKMADIRGGGGLTSSSNGRSDPPPQRNPNGIDQTGTNTGFKPSGFAEANGLLESLGIKGPRYGEFQSTKLSTGADAPSDREIFGGSKAEDQAIQAGGSVETVISANTDPITTIKTEGGANLTQSGGIKTTNPVNPEPETSVLGSRARYNQEFSAQDSNLKGLRAAEASKGLLYASGKYWKSNPNAGSEGQKDFVEISKEEWKSIKAGDSHAQDFLAQKVNETKATLGTGGSTDELSTNDTTHKTPPASKLNTENTTETNLTDAPANTDKDKTGRYNVFR